MRASRDFRLLISLLLTVFLSAAAWPATAEEGALSEDASWWLRERENGALRAKLMDQARLVAQLAELYAATHGGQYPANASEVMEMWPEARLVNLVTLAATEPVDGAAGNPGEIGYAEIRHGEDYVGYTVTAFARNSIVWVISFIDK